MQNNLSKARLISRALENSGYFTLLSNVHRPKPIGSIPTMSEVADVLTSHTKAVFRGQTKFTEVDAEFYYEGLPVVSFRFTDEFKQKYPNVKQQWIQLQLRGIGWIVPK